MQERNGYAVYLGYGCHGKAFIKSIILQPFHLCKNIEFQTVV